MNVTIYLPDDIANEVRAKGMNTSAVCRRALSAELGKHERGDGAARAAIDDARLALDRAETAIAAPLVTPDDVGVEMADAYQILMRAVEAHTAGNGRKAEDEVRRLCIRVSSLTEKVLGERWPMVSSEPTGKIAP